MTKSLTLDSGYSWVICAVNFFGYFIVIMGAGAFGVFLPFFSEDFSSSKATIALIGSLNSGTGAIASLFVSPLVTRFGCRTVSIAGSLVATLGYASCVFAQNITHLIIGYGILSGLGNGMIFYACALILQLYFDRCRTLATAIATIGISISSLVFPPLTRWLASQLGWRMTTVVLSAICLQNAIGGALMRPVNGHDNSGSSQTQEKLTKTEVHSSTWRRFSLLRCISRLVISVCASMDLSIFRNVRFFIFLIGSCLGLFGYFTPIFFINAHAMSSLGMSPARSAFLVSMIGLATLAGRIFSGILGDRLSFFRQSGRRIYLYSIPTALSGLAIAAIYWIEKEQTLLVFCFLIGFLTGCYVVVQQPVMVDLLGIDSFSKGLTFVLLFNGISTFLSQPIAGWLVDISSGDYRLAFLVSGLVEVVGGLLLISLIIIGPTEKTKELNTSVQVTGSVEDTFSNNGTSYVPLRLNDSGKATN